MSSITDSGSLSRSASWQELSDVESFHPIHQSGDESDVQSQQDLESDTESDTMSQSHVSDTDSSDDNHSVSGDPTPVKEKNWITKAGSWVVKKVVATWKNKIVRKVALEILLALGVVIVGGVLGALAAFSGSWIWLGVGILGGALAAGLTYLAVRSTLLIIQQIRNPANWHRKAPPMENEGRLNDKHYKEFKEIVAEASEQNWFKEWAQMKELQVSAQDLNDPESVRKSQKQTRKNCQKHLYHQLRKGMCRGEVEALLRLMPKHHQKSCSELTQGMQVKDVLYYQVLETISRDYVMQFQELKRQEAEFKNDPTKQNEYQQIKFQKILFKKRYEQIQSNFQFTSRKFKAMDAWKLEKQKKNADAQNPQDPAKDLDAQNFANKLKNDLSSLQTGQFATGSIRLAGEKKAHVIFFQMQKDATTGKVQWRFYDGYEKQAGFYEGNHTEEKALKILYKHLRRPSYKKFHSMQVKTYAVRS